MKVGAEYLHSPEKRAFDIAFSGMLALITPGVAGLAKITFSERGLLFYTDTRIGQYDREIFVKKIRTLGEDMLPINGMAKFFRTKGLDELPQLQNILSGTLTVFGRRALLPNEYEQLRDIASKTKEGRELLARRDEIVTPAKPGIFSSFAFFAHNVNSTDGALDPETILTRLKMDNYDHEHASFKYDLNVLLKGLGAALRGELTNHSVGMPEA